MALEDDNGKIHKFVIPNSYYIPEGRVRLLSPQHWAQTQKDFKPISGTKEITDHQTTVLYWKQMKFQKTVPLSSTNNVATFYMAPRFREFEAYKVKAGFKDDNKLILTEPVNIIEDDEGNVPFILHPKFDAFKAQEVPISWRR